MNDLLDHVSGRALVVKASLLYDGHDVDSSTHLQASRLSKEPDQ